MNLTSGIAAERREHVEARLREDPIAWLTTVRPDGQPDSVPVWFCLLEEETILVYSQPNKLKLRNIPQNPKVALGLDGTDIGRDVIRVEGLAKQVDDFPAAYERPEYAAKYADLMHSMFGTAERFAQLFCVPVLITPTRLRA